MTLTTINPITRFHRDHHHKISGFLAAVGVGLIIFPEPVVTDVIGLAIVGLAMLSAFLSDYIHNR